MNEPIGERQRTYRTVSDLPSVDGGGIGSLSFGSSRRQFMRRTFWGAVAFSLASLEWLPPARLAYAGHEGTGTYGYRIKGLPCPAASSGTAVAPSCGQGCGPSRICGEETSGFCCEPPSAHKVDYHKDSGNFRLRPEECTANDDGWRWKVDNACGCCGGGLKYRCHDGWWDNPDQGWVRRVCRAVTQCDPPFC